MLAEEYWQIVEGYVEFPAESMISGRNVPDAEISSVQQLGYWILTDVLVKEFLL